MAQDFLEVREAAIAAVRKYTHEGAQFDLSDFYDTIFPLKVRPLEIAPCGTTACFLGALALARHDGWHVSLRTENPTRLDESPTDGWGGIAFPAFEQARRYFGLSQGDAEAIFGVDAEVAAAFYGKPRSAVTLDEVCAALRAAPVIAWLSKPG